MSAVLCVLETSPGQGRVLREVVRPVAKGHFDEPEVERLRVALAREVERPLDEVRR